MRAIKQALDPLNLMNPGKLLGSPDTDYPHASETLNMTMDKTSQRRQFILTAAAAGIALAHPLASRPGPAGARHGSWPALPRAAPWMSPRAAWPTSCASVLAKSVVGREPHGRGRADRAVGR